jgi:hypothetical protein
LKIKEAREIDGIMFNHLSFAVGDKVHHAGVWGAMVLRN